MGLFFSRHYFSLPNFCHLSCHMHTHTVLFHIFAHAHTYTYTHTHHTCTHTHTHTHTQAYVIFLTEMGGGWVERHLSTVTQHILSLLSHPKTISTHIDAVYSRRCVSFILRSVFGQLLGESAQYVAVKRLCTLIMQTTVAGGQRSEVMMADREGDNGGIGGGGEREREGGKEGGGRDRSSSQLQQQQQQQQHIVICAILEVGALVFNLNTAALPLVVSDTPPTRVGGGVKMAGSGGEPSSKDQQQPPLFVALNRILMMPQLSARLAGAWCLHYVSLALPSHLSYLVAHCLSQLREPRKQTQVGISGFSYAVAALLGTVRCNELGLPSAKAREVLALGQEFVERGLKTSSGEKMALTYINGGWALIGGFISLGEYLLCISGTQPSGLYREVVSVQGSKSIVKELLGPNQVVFIERLSLNTGGL